MPRATSKATQTFSLDFGTTTVLAAVTNVDGVTEIKEIGTDPSSPFTMPSVAEVRDGSLIVGEDADQAGAERSVKSDITHNEFNTYGGFSSDDLMSAIITAAVARTGVSVGQSDRVRLGCPASWDRPRRERLADIAREAGLPNVTVGSIYDEATSAGVSWIMDQWRHGEHFSGNVLVLDMGGGTADVALLTVEAKATSASAAKGHSNLKVLSALGSGITLLDGSLLSLGGDDVDQALSASLKGLNTAWTEKERLYRIRVAREALTSAGLDSIPLDDRDPKSPRLEKPMVDKAVHNMMSEVASYLIVPTLRDAMVKFRSLEAHKAGAALLPAGQDETYVGGMQARQNVAQGQTIAVKDWPNWGIAGRNVVLVTGGLSRMPQVVSFVESMFGSSASFVRDESIINPEQAIVSGLMQYDESGVWSSLALPSIDLVLDGQVIHPSHTPVYDRVSVIKGTTFLGTEYDLGAAESLRKLEVRNADGTTARLGLIRDLRNPKDLEEVDYAPVRAGREPARIKFYATGHVLVVNGDGSTQKYNTDLSTPGPILPPRTGSDGGGAPGATPGEPG